MSMVLNENIIFHKINNEKQANIKKQPNHNPTYKTYLKKEETGIIKNPIVMDMFFLFFFIIDED